MENIGKINKWTDDYVVLKSIGSSKMGFIASKLKFQGL